MAMRLREVGEIGGLAAVYVIAARLGLAFDAVAGFATLVWPPTGSGKTRRYSGIGLGLTAARDLAHRMEGDVTIASRLGSGTTATVVLPAA